MTLDTNSTILKIKETFHSAVSKLDLI